ncbi:MAG: hypothetical protein NT069_26440 [Planctomycetota bacterium]|nr:hypothetical protein [Planctomycetota bacterium]
MGLMFTVYETAQSGNQRYDRATGTATTIWESPTAAPALNSYVAFDASFWSPAGTYLMQVFVNRNTINAATGLAVGNALTSPDNLAIDSKGNTYIVEDQQGGLADIWFATDSDHGLVV